METLSLKDDRLHDMLKPKSRRSGHRPARLPTPEASRSSLEAHESEDISDSQQTDPGNNATLRPLAGGQFRSFNSNAESSSSQFEQCRRQAPQSPPYEPLDDQRPSLPPLKTILGDTMSSPPRTPRALSLHLQPTPREPTYTTATYRPPSLYPNKKQKLEPLQPVPPFSSASIVSPRPNMLESQKRTAYSSNSSFHPSDAHYSEPINRAQSIQRSERLCRTPVSPRSFHGASLAPNYNIAPINHSQPHRGQPYQVSERFHASTLRRPSASSLDAYHSRPNDERADRNITQHNDRVYASPTMGNFRARDEVGDFVRTERENMQPSSELVRDPYQNGRHPDDLSGVPFEYFYTKARKRSNLPKHSTEIMRAWFDQNIANPYPSEDQKALFATATGISLTQVSNWFINHRRRCPELRDKRVERKKP